MSAAPNPETRWLHCPRLYCNEERVCASPTACRMSAAAQQRRWTCPTAVEAHEATHPGHFMRVEGERPVGAMTDADVILAWADEIDLSACFPGTTEYARRSALLHVAACIREQRADDRARPAAAVQP